MAITKRLRLKYLAYSDQYGVYLGGDNWSFINPGGKDKAPTYDNSIGAMNEMGNKNKRPFLMVQAFPDLDKDGNIAETEEARKFCSLDAIAASGLPRWDKNLVAGKPHNVQGPPSQFNKEQRAKEVAEAREENKKAGEVDETVEVPVHRIKRSRKKATKK